MIQSRVECRKEMYEFYLNPAFNETQSFQKSQTETPACHTVWEKAADAVASHASTETTVSMPVSATAINDPSVR